MPWNCNECPKKVSFATEKQLFKHIKIHPITAAGVKRLHMDQCLKELRKPGQQEHREAAFSYLTTEVELVDFTLGERKELLELCMTKNCKQEGEDLLQKLFYAWFDQCNQSPLALLQQLDVASSQQQLDNTGVRMSAPAKVIGLMIQGSQPKVWLEQFNRLLDETKVIPHSELTAEKAFYWRMMVLTFYREEDEHLEQILPELPEFLSFFHPIF